MTRASEGSGIGLVLTKSLVELATVLALSPFLGCIVISADDEFS
jgi:hypothetical protein